MELVGKVIIVAGSSINIVRALASSTKIYIEPHPPSEKYFDTKTWLLVFIKNSFQSIFSWF